jgi:Cu(I)/Ag(I) efflux system membrane fusion protein
MRRTALLAAFAAILIAAVGAGGGYWFAMHRMHAPAQPAADRTADTAAGTVDPATGRRVLYWHDPMVPGHKFDKPGKSPFMDMQLVPVYADAGGEEGSVAISPRTLQNLGIRTAEVLEGRMESGFSAVGAVGIDERTLTAVQSRVAGYVEKLHVRAQYDPVARGRPLVEIYAPEWLSAQEEFLALKRAARPGAEALALAARERLLLLGVPEAQIARIEAEGRPDPRVTLPAPQAGVVWELGVREGMAVGPGITLFKLAGLDPVWVDAEIPETAAARVRPGIAVEARAAAFPDRTFKGRVSTLLPDVNPTTRTVKARIVLANPGTQLKPGMYASIVFKADARPALMVPTEAVIRTGTRTVVIVAEAEGRFRPMEVETGNESGEMTEIRKGLKRGERVVASGQFLIDSEASLRGVLSRLEGAVDAQPAGKPSGGGHVGRGQVNEVDAAQGRIDITHGPIPSMKWPEMRMEFRVEDKARLGEIKPGEKIEFEMRGEPDAGGDYVITRIRRQDGRSEP